MAKVPEVVRVRSFYPRGSKLRFFLLYGQCFLRYRPILKIVIFGHETEQLAKVPEVSHMIVFLPQVVEIELVFTLWAAVSEIQDNYQNCPVWA